MKPFCFVTFSLCLFIFFSNPIAGLTKTNTSVDSLLFHLAVSMMLTENFSEAEACFAELAATSPGEAAVFNNRGVNLAMWGLSKLQKSEAEDLIKYIFPFAVAPNLGPKGYDDHRKNISRLFELAEENFKRATQIDPTFAEGYLNMACSQALLSRWNRDASLLRSAFDQVKIAEQKADKSSSTKGACLIVKGIIYDYLGNDDEREENFRLARKHFELNPDLNLASLVERNQAVASGSAAVFVNTNGEQYNVMEDEPETIDGKRLSQLIRNANLDVDKEITTIGKAKIYSKTYSQSSLFVYFRSADHFLFFHRTEKGYFQKTSKGIGIGDHEAHIIQTYGSPLRVWPALGGRYLFYQKAKLLFFVGKNGTVENWLVWRRKQ